MALSASDILLKYSTTAGSAGNSNTSTQAASLGKYISTTQPTDNTLNDWFRDFTAAENAGLVVLYRCLFVHNNHATDAWNGTPSVYISTVPTGLAIAISVDTTGITAKGSASAQAKTIASETTAPATQTFTSPTTIGAALPFGSSIAAGSVAAVWVRLTGTAGSATFPDTEALTFTGTT